MLPNLIEFTPILKRARWGGVRLGTVLGKSIGAESDNAESWELVDRAREQSEVAGGMLNGWTLRRIVNEHGPELFGTPDHPAQFPLLIKFLDAHDRLSVQVHPNDEQAKRVDAAETGKSEAWVILEADPPSRVYAGLKDGVDRALLERAIVGGHIEDVLHSFEVSVGDCISIPAGTVHALGEGILLAEIQQPSDLTFRLFDWGRVEPNGKPRELHIPQALDCTDFNRGPVSPIVPAVISEGCEELVRSPYFVIRRHRENAPFQMPIKQGFHVLMAIEGAAEIESGGTRRAFSRGKALLAPATAADAWIEPHGGDVTVLDVFVPE